MGKKSLKRILGFWDVFLFGIGLVLGAGIYAIIGNAPNYAIIAIALVAIGFGLIGNLKRVASISNMFIFIVFGTVNLSLLRYRFKNRDGEKPPFKIPLNVNNIPIPTILALCTVLILFGYNIYNLF